MGLFFILSGFLLTVFLMVISKRLTALIRVFRLQSVFLFLYMILMAFTQKHLELFVVCGLIAVLKIGVIPSFLARIARRINAEEDLCSVVNPQASLIAAFFLCYLSYIFARNIMPQSELPGLAVFFVSIAAICVSFFIMVSRMKALSQVLGLLSMENGIFLAAAAITGGLPFFVEIALSFDIIVFVIIAKVFVYRVNRLFAHIDTSKMNSLKG